MKLIETLYEFNENEIRDLLLYHKITKVSGSELILDNGVILEINGNNGCLGCESGNYELTELNGCDNVITNVEFICDQDVMDDFGDTSYKIFVFAEDNRIKLLQVDGSDGNGYYGTGYHINVKIKDEC